jgi:hypothetical protein
MFLKSPKPSTDPRLRSLLQKASRRGYPHVVELAFTRLNQIGDRTWLRSRAIVITFEECWPLATFLSVNRQASSKWNALQSVAKAAKQKDAAGLGALAYAYKEGDRSMLDVVPDKRVLKIVSEALLRPREFFDWVVGQSKRQNTTDVIWSAQRYLPAATWQWDKACILAGALLATIDDMPTIEAGETPSGEFPYWVALDKHTPQGKAALREVASQVNSSYRQLVWASFYFESASVNRLLPSPWWDAEKLWRFRRSGLSLREGEELWLRVRPLVRERLERESASLKKLLETEPSPGDLAGRDKLL